MHDASTCFNHWISLIMLDQVTKTIKLISSTHVVFIVLQLYNHTFFFSNCKLRKKNITKQKMHVQKKSVLNVSPEIWSSHEWHDHRYAPTRRNHQVYSEILVQETNRSCRAPASVFQPLSPTNGRETTFQHTERRKRLKKLWFSLETLTQSQAFPFSYIITLYIHIHIYTSQSLDRRSWVDTSTRLSRRSFLAADHRFPYKIAPVQIVLRTFHLHIGRKSRQCFGFWCALLRHYACGQSRDKQNDFLYYTSLLSTVNFFFT